MRNTSLLNLFLLFAGVWLLVSPFLLGYNSVEIARNNDVYVGLVVVLLALVALFWRRSNFSSIAWIAGVAGLWEISAPFVLVYSNTLAALANGVVVGMFVVGLSLWQILLSPEESEVITRHFRSESFGPRYASELNRRRKTRAQTDNEKDPA